MQLKQIMRLSLLTCALFIQTPYVSGQTNNSQYSLGTEYEKFLDWNKKLAFLVSILMRLLMKLLGG